MPFPPISSVFPIFKGALSLWKFWRKPIEIHRSEQTLEILKCWLCHSHAQDLVVFDTPFATGFERQAFECLSVFYRRGDIYGIVFFGGKDETPQKVDRVLLPQALADLTEHEISRALLDRNKLKEYLAFGRFRITECLYLNSSGYIASQPPRSWEPRCIFGTASHERPLPTPEKIANEIDVETISLEAIKRIKQGNQIDIPQAFCDDIQSGWDPDLEALIRQRTKERRRKMDSYETPGWSFLNDRNTHRKSAGVDSRNTG